MIPIMQTEFYDPALPDEQQSGDCLRAAVASMLDLPLLDVPHFVEDEVAHPGDSAFWWFNCLQRWLGERGLMLSGCDDDERPGEHVMRIGKSPRAYKSGRRVGHIAIYRDGSLAHDPHPDATGVLSPFNSYRIEDALVGDETPGTGTICAPGDEDDFINEKLR